MRDDDLTPSEKKAMETLPKERMPKAPLEDRVVNALHGEGLLQSKRRVIELTTMRMAAAIAACVALVIGGFAMGTVAGSQRMPQAISTQSDEIPVAASLQRAGTAYVSVLEDLAGMPAAGSDEEIRQGREVALKTLYTAADQMTHIIHNERLSTCIVQAIAQTSGAETEQTKSQIIQF